MLWAPDNVTLMDTQALMFLLEFAIVIAMGYM